MKKILLIGLVFALNPSISKAQDGAQSNIGIVISSSPSLGPNTFNGAQIINISGIATTSTDALLITNTTAATVSITRQQSPRIKFHGSGWDSNDAISRNQDFWIETQAVTSTIPYGILNFGTNNPNVSTTTFYPLQLTQRGYVIVGSTDNTSAYGFTLSGNGIKLVSRDSDVDSARPEFYPGNIQAISNEVLTAGSPLYTSIQAHGSSAQEAGVSAQFRAYNNSYASNVYGIAGAGLTRFIGYNTTGVLFGVDDDVPLYLGQNSTIRWKLVSSGHFLAQADNTYDIGATGATRPRTGYFGTSLVVPKYLSSTAAPGLTSCGTGTIDTNSTDFAGKVTATGATACTVTFTTTYPTAAWCVISDDTTIGKGIISAQSASAFTVSQLISGDSFQYVCGGK